MALPAPGKAVSRKARPLRVLAGFRASHSSYDITTLQAAGNMNWEARNKAGAVMYRKTWVWEGHSPSLSKGVPEHEMMVAQTLS